MKFILLFGFFALSFAECTGNTFWDGTNCVQCPTNCETCYSETKCTSCTGDFILDKTYQCVAFKAVTYCAKHDGNNCVQCDDGYFLQGNECLKCTDHVLENCLKCNMNKCFKCEGNLVLHEEGDKQECIDCSKSENDVKCGRCPIGTYFNTTYMNCENCYDDCQRCTNATNCYLCKENHALNDPSNPESGCGKIANCLDGHYYGNHCELCKDGYFVLDGYCEKCIDNCRRCINNETCVSCMDGYELTEGNCTRLEHCKRSSDLLGCLECESGFFLNVTTGHCDPCDKSCKTCKDDKICFTCNTGYYFTNKAEGKCSEMDVQKCEAVDQYGCLQCKTEIDKSIWQTFENKDDIEEAFKKSAKDVLGVDDYQTTTDDKIGFYVAYNYSDSLNIPIYEQECSMCDVSCMICEYNATWCTACNEGYQMTENEEATELYEKHFKTNKTIYSCLKKSDTCAELQVGYCTTCKDNYFLSEMVCTQCDVRCSSCVNDNNCQTCQPGTTKQINGIDATEYWRPKTYSDILDPNQKGLCWMTNETWEDYHLNNCQSIGTAGCTTCNAGYYKNENWGGCKKCPSECSECKLLDTEFEKDENAFKGTTNANTAENNRDKFQCTACKNSQTDPNGIGEILKDGKCVKCAETIEFCVKCDGTGCIECDSNYQLNDEGTCSISDLVIAIPIVSVAVVIFIIIIIIIVIVVWKYRKEKAKKESEGIRPFKVTSELEMALLSANNESFPLKTDKWTLYFGHKGNKVPIDTEFEEEVTVQNPTKKSYYFEVLTGQSHKYELTAEPMRYTLKAGLALTVKFKIKMLCTAVVNDEIGIIAMDTNEEEKETAKITITIESDLSTKLDHEELKLQMPAIGEGAFGIVFVGTYRGQKVAVKKMRARNLTEEQEKEFKHEVNMMTQYRHATIVNLIGAVYTEGEISIVTEFAEYGSLSKLWNKGQQITYDLKIKLMEDTVVSLAYLHENQIIHRDVKGENVLVYALNPHSPVCGKLTDFGTTRPISERALSQKPLTNGIGTPTYMSPECLENAAYSYPTDVYSFGIVLYETYIERNAYDDDERFNQPWQIPQFVIEGSRLEKPNGIPEDYWNLLSLCWSQEQTKRPTFAQVYSTLAAMDVDITHTEMSSMNDNVNVGEY